MPMPAIPQVESGDSSRSSRPHEDAALSSFSVNPAAASSVNVPYVGDGVNCNATRAILWPAGAGYLAERQERRKALRNISAPSGSRTPENAANSSIIGVPGPVRQDNEFESHAKPDRIR
jgi:hypothetical protein